MGLGIIGIIIALIIALILFKLIKFGLKVITLVIITIALSVTVWICLSQPDMHKPFSMDTIEYLFKINKDGSLTTTKQVTKTIYQETGANSDKGVNRSK